MDGSSRLQLLDSPALISQGPRLVQFLNVSQHTWTNEKSSKNTYFYAQTLLTPLPFLTRTGNTALPVCAIRFRFRFVVMSPIACCCLEDRTSQRKVVTCYIVRTELVVSNALVVSISNALMFFCKARGHLLNGRLRVSRSSVPLLRFSSFSLFSKNVIYPIACNIHT